MNISFVYIAEAYQCYHGAAIAAELAKCPGIRVTSYYVDPDTPRHLERIHQAFGAPSPQVAPLVQSVSTRLLRAIKRLGTFKNLVLRDNRERLNGYDAIVAVENTVAMARGEGIGRPRLIYKPHGFGDRAYGFVPRIAAFDFVLLAGPKTEARMLAHNCIHPGRYALTGSIKLETASRLHSAGGSLFGRARPTILYNPHFDPKLSSWDRFAAPMIEQFTDHDRFNLIVAPHVKLFRRRFAPPRDQWEKRSSANVLVDMGSDRSVDGSYLAAADIYVGDASSQVYEFLANPRPCIFLNAHGVDWRDSPNFAHWHLGDVISRPDQLAAALTAAPSRHEHYRPLQEALASATLGQSAAGAAARAAAAIIGFLTASA